MSGSSPQIAGRNATIDDRARALSRFESIRGQTLALTRGLSAEDQALQTMADVSPTKWHLAHTTWFFETFLLAAHLDAYTPFDPRFDYLFNSYYEAVGPRHPRAQRGLISRPSVETIHSYRAHVDAAIARLIHTTPDAAWPEIAKLLEIGRHHEQQHQELLLMDIKHVFSTNPLLPAYRPALASMNEAEAELKWVRFDGGLIEIGHEGDAFAFDNEGPRHKTYVEPFALASRLATNADYLRFIEEDGYDRPEFWLSDGWAQVQAEGWYAPLYWQRDQRGDWSEFTLAGLRPLQDHQPVCHLSYYEADAFARWSGKRLPREAEWEHAAASVPLAGNLADRMLYHPAPTGGPPPELQQMIGDCWEWTQSPYSPYPRYRPASGALGEYNGKFMCNQMVLRGGSALTPADHIRTSYRNFFPPHARWMMSGVRLADDA